MKDTLTYRLFFAGVHFLTWLGEKLELTYEAINIWTFYIIWPIVTLASVGLNLYFLFFNS